MDPLELARIDGFLFDIDGVLLDDGEVIEGSVEAIRALAAAGKRLRFVTNTTAQTRAQLLRTLRSIGVPLESNHLFTPASLARRVLEREEAATYRLLAAPELAEDLGPGQLALDAPERPDWVIMGLYPSMFRHDTFNIALRDILAGARLMALHANRLWRTSRGFELGLGAYVNALSYGARVEPLVIGKPSATFFEEAIAGVQMDRQRIVMVGDDVDADVGGAQAVGVHGVLVRTGKFTERSLRESGVHPGLVVDDAADLARRVLGAA